MRTGVNVGSGGDRMSSARQWGSVREDYSDDGAAWEYFPHDHARSRAYRWGEDGLAGICDRWQHLCFAIALWNERDEILKERLFGLTNPEGNHGEDAKEEWWHIDSTPTHSWMQWLYKYPQAAFPYGRLLDENRRRSRFDREFELADTGVFDDGRYFDVLVTYAKAAPDDLCVVGRGHQSWRPSAQRSTCFRPCGSATRGRGGGTTDGHGCMPMSGSGNRIIADHGLVGRRWLSAGSSPAAAPTPLL